MECFQELSFTDYLAFISSVVLAGIVSFAASTCTVVSSVNEGGTEKEVFVGSLSNGKNEKGKKRVKFGDDLVIKRVDHYQGHESRPFMDDVEEQSVDERVGQENGLNGIEEHCFDAQEKGLDKNELVIEEENHEDDKINGVLGKYEIGEVKNAILENQRLDMSSGLKNEILENQESQVEFEVTDQIVVENEDGVEVRIEEKHDDDDDEMILESSEVKNEGEVDVCSEVKSEIVENEESENDENGEEDIVKKVSPEDDWEGIERSELERDFAEAVNYVECGGKEKEKKLKLGVQLDLYGLHKVAVQGSCQCHHPQPMPFKLSARAKWNAWQRLGSMSREEAMERYIRLVSDRIPHWKEAVPELKTKLQIDH